jgi:hypothetical protein
MRQCGGCTLCCKLVPVPSIDKGAGVRCRHQRSGKGCAVYARPNMPLDCQLWSCRWLTEDDTADLSRPDRAHYVIDIMPDFVTMTYEGEPPRRVPVVQIWIDPKFPDAHRDPALRAFIARRGERDGMAALIRWNNQDAFVIFPPAIASDGKWHEEHSGIADKQHSFAEIAKVIEER